MRKYKQIRQCDRIALLVLSVAIGTALFFNIFNTENVPVSPPTSAKSPIFAEKCSRRLAPNNASKNSQSSSETESSTETEEDENGQKRAEYLFERFAADAHLPDPFEEIVNRLDSPVQIFRNS